MELSNIDHGIPAGWETWAFVPWKTDLYAVHSGVGWITSSPSICFAGLEWGRKAATRIDKAFWYKDDLHPVWPRRGWWKEVNKHFFPIKVEVIEGHEWAVVEDSSLIKFCVLDLPARYPGVYFAYMRLRKMLPNQNPWYLFQVAHMLPVCSKRIIDPRCTSDMVGYALKMQGGNKGHALGEMVGVVPISKEPFMEALQKEPSCNELFGFGRFMEERKYIPLDWTWKQFSQWADQYIKEQTT